MDAGDPSTSLPYTLPWRPPSENGWMGVRESDYLVRCDGNEVEADTKKWPRWTKTQSETMRKLG
jgi:hypothetical protein